jgi:transcriptional regulator with XRE-family HTH domain
MKNVVPRPFPSEPLLQQPAEFGAAIRSARTSAGLTLEDAAAGLGISKQTLLNLERGKGTVSLGTALDAAVQLGVALFMAPSNRRELIRRSIVSGA